MKNNNDRLHRAAYNPRARATDYKTSRSEARRLRARNVETMIRNGVSIRSTARGLGLQEAEVRQIAASLGLLDGDTTEGST